ncbi:unnamed protein product [Polarella glacialis]|uniref:Uncharacterized protein n=1 Tax=Polarella glacialis TaxID=89957 RepID=A0A813LWJ6_POLGL|nr:unnamed protein product [Polarella glacialis]
MAGRQAAEDMRQARTEELRESMRRLAQGAEEDFEKLLGFAGFVIFLFWAV